MAIRAKLVIIFFTFIIVPMFLLWARWQGTAIGSIKAVLRQGLQDRAKEISDQISKSLEIHKAKPILPSMPAPSRGIRRLTPIKISNTIYRRFCRPTRASIRL
jgi:hypothetical protein